MINKSSNKIITRNKEILGGTPVFKGTRVPVKALWDYLKAVDTVEDFLEDFPSVGRVELKYSSEFLMLVLKLIPKI
jgi:uncharacterized protein (DUF433 family)